MVDRPPTANERQALQLVFDDQRHGSRTRAKFPGYAGRSTRALSGLERKGLVAKFATWNGRAVPDGKMLWRLTPAGYKELGYVGE